MENMTDPVKPLPPQQTEAGERLQQYPPPETWDDWVEWDPAQWPKKVPKHYMLVPTVCFNCESACGLLGWVDKDSLQVRKFEGNPAHPGSRGRNCAKGPATLNQVNDPDRILYPSSAPARAARANGCASPGRKRLKTSAAASVRRSRKGGTMRSCITS